jgi:hypothetical protein
VWTLRGIVASVLLGAGLAAPAHSATLSCPPPGSRTLISHRDARLYTNRGALQGCVTGADLLVPFGSQGTFYRPPVMALSGHFAAVVINDPNRDDPYQVTVIEMVRNGYVRGIRRPEERIGSLRVRPDGAVAFIACPPGRYDPTDPPITPGPTCMHAGRWRNTVVLALPHRAPRGLGRGRRLDPASLQMSNTTVSWLQDGHRRRVRYRTG